MKDREIAILFRLITGVLGNEMGQGTDMGRLIRLSYQHKVAYQMLLFAQKNPGLFSSGELQKLHENNRMVALKALSQLHALRKLSIVFREKNISFISIKGPQLSRMLYGREALKDSVDLDLMLVKGEKDLAAVHALLTEAGYTRSNLNDYPGRFRRKLFLIAKREISYFNPDTRIAIDLHIRPGANTYLTEHRFEDFFQRLKEFDLEGTSVTVLSDEAYFVYLCYHGALHQFGRLAWLADIRAFLKLKGESMDQQEIQVIAAKWRVTHCVDLALRLIKDYFNEQYISYLTPVSGRMNFLATSCKNVLYRKPGYGMSVAGRINKTIYIQFLVEGFAARIDWFYGIAMRKMIQLLARSNR